MAPEVLFMELIRDIANELNVNQLCHKILVNVCVLVSWQVLFEQTLHTAWLPCEFQVLSPLNRRMTKITLQKTTKLVLILKIKSEFVN